MTRSSRYCGENSGRSKSWHSPHDRKWRRRKDNDSKRSARCHQRSDIADGHYEPKYYATKWRLGFNRYTCHHGPHYCNGNQHVESKPMCIDFSELVHKYTYPTYTWDYDGSDWALDIDTYSKMKENWNNLTSEQRLAVFENAISNKSFLDYVRKISYGECTIEQFACVVSYVENRQTDNVFNTINVEVAIKRMARRGGRNKFVSHRNHKEKYSY